MSDLLIVTAEIKKISPHPDSHKLKVCEVFDGKEVLQVVCGASNTRLGMLTFLAKVGATLPSGTLIKEANLRGVLSQGMLCSPKDLSLSDESGLIDLSPSISCGERLSNITKLSALPLSSTPWYQFKLVETMIEGPGRDIKVLKGEVKNLTGKVLSQTYFHEGKYLYRHA